MLVRPHSDIHLDSWFRTRKRKGERRVILTPELMRSDLETLIPRLPHDKDTVLVLAGDIWEGLRPILYGKHGLLRVCRVRGTLQGGRGGVGQSRFLR